MLQIIQFTPTDTVKADKFESFVNDKLVPSLGATPGVIGVRAYKLDESDPKKQWQYVVIGTWDNRNMYNSRDLNKKFWNLYKLLVESSKYIREYSYNEL